MIGFMLGALVAAYLVSRVALRRMLRLDALARVGHLASPEPRRLAGDEQEQCERNRRNDPGASCTCGVVSWARDVPSPCPPVRR